MPEPRTRRLLWLSRQAPGQATSQPLADAGWQLLHLDPSPTGIAWLRRLAPDVVVVQLQPAELGVLAQARAATESPILVLTVAHDEAAQLRLFEAGADALLHSHSSPRLVLARLAALERLRRGASASVHVGELLVPTPQDLRRPSDLRLDLSPTEQALLDELLRQQGQAVTRRALDACLSPRQRQRHERTVDVLISRLRMRLKALAVDDVQIRAVPGVGYCLTTAAAASLS